jgi:hypothetical protein
MAKLIRLLLRESKVITVMKKAAFQVAYADVKTLSCTKEGLIPSKKQA